LRLLDCKQDSCQDIADAAPKNAGCLCPQCDEHFTDLQKYLGLLEIPFVLNHRMVRGLDYYTRTVFEIQPETGSNQSSLGGGGRYDDLIEELGGKPTPAAGFAAGIERIILNLKEQDIPVPVTPILRVLIAHMGDASREAAMKLAAGLRQAGTSAVTTTGDKRLKPQLRQANSLGIPYVIIIGEDEVRSGTATVRDMANARQETVAIGDVPEFLSRLP
jgi:histidyl-tRNA synthetase